MKNAKVMHAITAMRYHNFQRFIFLNLINKRTIPVARRIAINMNMKEVPSSIGGRSKLNGRFSKETSPVSVKVLWSMYWFMINRPIICVMKKIAISQVVIFRVCFMEIF